MLTPQKILIIRLSSLGDILLTTPIVRCLRKKFPHTQIDFVLKSEYADVYRFNQHLNNLYEIKSGKRDELNLLRKKIRQARYDILIDLQNNFRSRYLRLFSFSRYTRIINKRIFRRFLFVKFGFKLLSENQHVVDRYFETVKKFGVVYDGQGLEIGIPNESKEIIKPIADSKKLSLHDPIVGFAPSAKHFTKRWMQDRFVHLGIDLAKKNNSKIFIFGSRDEVEYCKDIVQMINYKSGSNVAENLAGKTNLLETAALLDYCSVIVSNDSGLMHLAAARKKKIVAIFGSTVKELGFFPYGTENTIVEAKNISCRPCSHIGRAECPKKHFNCMNQISIEDVAASIKMMLTK
ncbi:MAG: lipopolysaccharide heptosyltransferase II [Ignavibacteriales bacterium]|nr:lipopolysaccharide heptosyltransferase II [Ignavibacteriales bacterium]